MAFRIASQEFQLRADRTGGSIRTRVPKEEITDAMILIEIQRFNLSAGDAVTVQVMSHDYSELLHEVEYRVTSLQVAMRTVDTTDSGGTRTFEEQTYGIARIGDWWDAPMTAKAPVADAEAGRYIRSAASMRRNPQTRLFEVIVGTEIMFTTENKELALSVARGDAPIPRLEIAVA